MREQQLQQLRQSLRPGQQSLADWKGGQMAISAVPGAGKSHSLSVAAALAVARYQLHDRRQLVIVTYTRSAAASIKAKIRERLKSLLLPQRGFVVHTLHGLALHIANRHPDLSALNLETATVIIPSLSHRIIRACVEQWIAATPHRYQVLLEGVQFDGEETERLRRQSVLRTEVLPSLAHTVIREAKSSGLLPENLWELSQQTTDEYQILAVAAGLYEQYEKLMRSRDLIDYDDMILAALRVLDNKAIRQMWQNQVFAVFEDEAQDSSPLQEKLISLLAVDSTNSNAPPNLVRVGDPNQAINSSFTPADPVYFNWFCETCKAQGKLATMDRAGRSSQIIIDGANFVLKWVNRGWGEGERGRQGGQGEGETGRGGDGEMGRWGDGEMGRISQSTINNQQSTINNQQTTNNKQQTTIHFEVEDTGAGIAPEELDRLFEAFVQTQTGVEAQEGTGLGLPISHKFVQLMGGELTVSSEVGQGTTFKFDIPVSVVDAREVQSQEPQRRIIALEPNQPRYRVLVVDDKQMNRRLLVKLLNLLDFEIEEASNGQEAVEIWERWEPHLIWMDLRMPVMNGYEATKQIKSQLKGQATAIIAITASTLEEERAVVLSAGCDDFVRKPFRESVIFEKMAQHLGLRYLYQDQSTPSSTQSVATGMKTSLEEDLAKMPQTWVSQLQEAAKKLDDQGIFQLLEQIEGQHPSLATALTDWTKKLRFDLILNSIELTQK